jgi:hypothetical protein
LEVLKYYYKSLLITNASPKFHSEKEITIPYRTDLTNYNKPNFFQSIFDHASINNPCNSLKETIITYQKYSTTIKTSVDDNVFPKTNIKNQYTNNQYKELIRYFCTYESYSAILISVVNSRYYESPQLHIGIYETYGHLHKEYIVTASKPKIVIDLTGDLAAARSAQKIVSAQFATMENINEFYKNCINILNNIFISYTYED